MDSAEVVSDPSPALPARDVALRDAVAQPERVAVGCEARPNCQQRAARPHPGRSQRQHGAGRSARRDGISGHRRLPAAILGQQGMVAGHSRRGQDGGEGAVHPRRDRQRDRAVVGDDHGRAGGEPGPGQRQAYSRTDHRRPHRQVGHAHRRSGAPDRERREAGEWLRKQGRSPVGDLGEVEQQGR